LLGDLWPSLSIYGNLLIESVSSVFHFRRVTFFNKKNKALFQTLEVRGAFADHQMTFPCHLLHSCSIDGELWACSKASLSSWSSQDAVPDETRPTVWTFHYSSRPGLLRSRCCPLRVLRLLWLRSHFKKIVDDLDVWRTSISNR